MNTKPVVVSLLVNVGLGLAVALVLVNRPAGPAPAPADQSTQTNAVASGTLSPNPLRVATNLVTQKFDWRQVESADYRKYIANLRGFGCPEETIRDIIIADVNKLFESRRRELTASTNKFLYWKAVNLAETRNPERLEKLKALNQEKHDLLVELLGSAPAENPNLFGNYYSQFDTLLDFLPAEKQSQITDAMMAYETKMMKLYENGQVDGEDVRKMQQLQKDMEAELVGMLTPEEYRQYQLRASQTAMSMRYSLASFGPNQEEFDKIFDLRKKYDDDYSILSRGEAAQEDRDKAKAARNAVNDQIKAMLGDERYAEYNRAQDSIFQTIYGITEQFGVPKDAAVKVYDMRKAVQQEAKRIKGDTSLTPAQRDAALLAVQNQTQESVVSLMGEKAWKAYKTRAPWFNKITQIEQ